MLNDIQCRNAKPRAKPYKLTVSNGLYLEVKPNGVKAWRYRFRLNGKESVFAIGEYPAISLVDAGKKREAARDLVKQGINPAHNRQLEKLKIGQDAAATFKTVAQEWLDLQDWKKVTRDRRLNMLERVAFPTIGTLPVKQITSPMILDLLKKVADKNGVTVMAEAKRTMYGIFELHSEGADDYANPVRKWKESLPKNKTQHKRALTDEEIGQLLRDIDRYQGGFQVVAAFRLMWLTLCRPSEAIEAEWSEFDLDAAIWRIPGDDGEIAGRMKMGKEHVIPLPTQAVELLRSMHGITGKHTHVFPNRDNRTKPMTSASLRQALRILKWSGKYSPHATRTTGSTKLNGMGYRSDWIERQLAHDEKDKVRGTYNHADYLVDRAKMMQHWADFIDGLKEGGKVLSFKKIA
jgi:integrase